MENIKNLFDLSPDMIPQKISEMSIPKIDLARSPTPKIRLSRHNSFSSNDSEKRRRLEFVISDKGKLSLEEVLTDAVEVVEEVVDVVEDVKKKAKKTWSLFKSCTCINVKGSAI